MASYHFHLTQVKRSRGQSVIAQAAYRAGEKLYSTYYGESSDFTRKRGVVMAEICLPDHAPREYADRETLWNALEWAESGRKAQLVPIRPLKEDGTWGIKERKEDSGDG